MCVLYTVYMYMCVWMCMCVSNGVFFEPECRGKQLSGSAL